MIQDAADYPDHDSLSADIAIVGAGAAGITLALELIGSGRTVVLAESGGLEEEPPTQALYAGSVEDERLHSPPDRYRQRRFGGTTTIWGGRCMPFDTIDFEQRDYVPHSGWPIGLPQLLPFYERASLLCEAGPYAYTAGEAFGTRAREIIDGFASPHFTTDRLERFSCPTNFAARYGHRLRKAANVRVLLHANLVEIVLGDAAERVDHLLLRSLAGRTLRLRARHYVIAAGGLETARLLLASSRQRPGGIGNDHDVVGRYYMCHLAGTIGALRIERPRSAVHHGYQVSDEGIYCRRRFALDEDVQRRLGLGNFIARLHHPRITDPAHLSAMLSLLFLAKPLIPYEYARRLIGEQPTSVGDWLRHVANVLTGPFDAATFAWHMVRDRILAERKFPSIIIQSKANLFSLDFHAEQFPNPESRVSLDPATDPLGVPRIRIDWRYGSGDVHSVRGALRLLATDFATAGVGTLVYDPGSVEAEMTRYGAYGGHHIGTARMGTDPRSSVVDANCRLHSVDNLYLAGSATFPTSSQANPTMTIVALALRLAGHLRGLTA
jgi:choline dehydrogenase-like flavoprotein